VNSGRVVAPNVFANDVVMPGSVAAMMALAGGSTGDALSRPLATLRDAFAKLEQKVARGGGPFFMGSAFTLVDAAYAPFFRRWREAEGWGEPGARLLAGVPVVSAWANALLAHPSVANAAPSEVGPRTRRVFADRAAKARAT
jgi:glutathione S-transferase